MVILVLPNYLEVATKCIICAEGMLQEDTCGTNSFGNLGWWLGFSNFLTAILHLARLELCVDLSWLHFAISCLHLLQKSYVCNFAIFC